MSDELPAAVMAGESGARPGGTWGSALTTQEFAAIRSVGFEPVGQVFGAAVYAAGDARGYDCPGAPGSSGATTLATQVSGQGDLGSFGLLVEAMYRARHTATGRMAAECAGLGGHGVVASRSGCGTMTGHGPADPAVVGQRGGGRLDRTGQRVAARCQTSAGS